jgi:hypothetical protein
MEEIIFLIQFFPLQILVLTEERGTQPELKNKNKKARVFFGKNPEIIY